MNQCNQNAPWVTLLLCLGLEVLCTDDDLIKHTSSVTFHGLPLLVRSGAATATHIYIFLDLITDSLSLLVISGVDLETKNNH